MQVLSAIVLLGCNPAEKSNGPFELGRPCGVNENRDLEETSGLTASGNYPGFLWAHNDSGHPAELFLLDSNAQTTASFRVAGARNRDWEDITRLTIDSTSLLFIGDLGDNNRKHGLKIIYCVPEPPRLEGVTELTPSSTLWIHLSGGYRDMEALMADPVTRSLFLVSKREHEVNVYEITYPYPTDTINLEPILEIPVSQITAADISPDGREILMKNYRNVFYWKRLAGQTVAEALMTPPKTLPYEPEPQGETIAWASDGSGYFTLSENAKGERGRLYFYPRSHQVDSTLIR